jgi:transposase
MSERVIGIRHRVKKTAEGEARPTQVAILENGKIRNLNIETETDELDFVLGRFPTSWRDVDPAEDIASVLEHHVKYRKIKEDETAELFHASQIRKVGKEIEVADKIPVTFEGFRLGDKIAMMLGGSGDNLAYALARHGKEIGSHVFRVSPATFKKMTGREKPDDEDAAILANLLATDPSPFYEVGPRDLALIWLRECLRARVDAMKARIASEQRLRQRLIGKIFCSPEGKFPEGSVEKQFDDAKTNDAIYQALLAEEHKRERELEKACEALDIYTALFEPVMGMGPMIASRIIGAVIDIRRFETKAKMRAFCGVHILKDGRFPRRRNNQVANWNGDCRQALYLLGDQFNRRKESDWGVKLIEAKAKYRTTHPYPVLVTKEGDQYELREGTFTKSAKGYTITMHVGDETMQIEGVKGTRRYTKGHIKKMATWYVLGKFIESLFNGWWKLEKAEVGPKTEPSAPADSATPVVQEIKSIKSGDDLKKKEAAA